jgi:hypothetical protein
MGPTLRPAGYGAVALRRNHGSRVWTTFRDSTVCREGYNVGFSPFQSKMRVWSLPVRLGMQSSSMGFPDAPTARCPQVREGTPEGWCVPTLVEEEDSMPQRGDRLPRGFCCRRRPSEAMRAESARIGHRARTGTGDGQGGMVASPRFAKGRSGSTERCTVAGREMQPVQYR